MSDHGSASLNKYIQNYGLLPGLKVASICQQAHTIQSTQTTSSPTAPSSKSSTTTHSNQSMAWEIGQKKTICVSILSRHSIWSNHLINFRSHLIFLLHYFLYLIYINFSKTVTNHTVQFLF
jgi:hypothetical protein